MLDWSIKKVTIKEIWMLRWYIDWPVGTAFLPDWPAWMNDVPDPGL